MDVFFSKNEKERYQENFDNYKMSLSKRLFSAECTVFSGESMKPTDALMIIDCGMITFLYKSNNNTLYSPIYLGNVRKFLFSENAQTRCAFKVDMSTERKIKQSHVIFETKSMGLFICYVKTLQAYAIKFEFDDTFSVTFGQQTIDFNFYHLMLR